MITNKQGTSRAGSKQIEGNADFRAVDYAGARAIFADDMIAFGRMLMRGGGPVLKSATVAEMTRDQLTETQRANVWPGFSFLDDRGWGYGLSVVGDGRHTWDGGLGTTWSNVPSQDLTVVVLTQRAADDTGMPAVCDEVLTAARTSVNPAATGPARS